MVKKTILGAEKPGKRFFLFSRQFKKCRKNVSRVFHPERLLFSMKKNSSTIFLLISNSFPNRWRVSNVLNFRFLTKKRKFFHWRFTNFERQQKLFIFSLLPINRQHLPTHRDLKLGGPIANLPCKPYTAYIQIFFSKMSTIDES